MNKLIALCGLVMLGTTTTPQEGYNGLESYNQEVEVIMTSTDECNAVSYTAVISNNTPTVKWVTNIEREQPVEISLDDIVYLEEEADLDLGFDTSDYLPEDFDPYQQYVNLDAIEFIEEEDLDLGYDTAAYLPEGFNPYANPANVFSIDYIEEGEDDFDLGFDTAEYLPEGFDPHEFYVNLDAIEYIEDDELGPNFWTVDYYLSL